MGYTHPKKNINFHGDKNDESQLFIGHTITIFWAEAPGAAEPADWRHGGSLRRAVTVLAMSCWVVDHCGGSKV